MVETPVTLKRLRLTAPPGRDPQAFGQSVADALHRDLPAAGVTGDLGTLHVTVTAAEAADPAALSRAVLRALRGGGS